MQENQFTVVQNRSNKKKKQKGKFSSFFTNLFSFVKNETFGKVVGLISLLTAIYLFISFTSYLFTWKTDQSIVSSSGWKIILETDPNIIENWLGVLGAVTAHYFIYNWFGLSSYFFSLWLFLFGYRILFKIHLLSPSKTFRYSLLAIIWISITLAFSLSDNYKFFGGYFGYFISNWLSTMLGTIGTGLLLFFSFTGFVVIVFNISLANLIKTFLQKKEPEIANVSSENKISNKNTVDTNENPTNKRHFDLEITNEEVLQKTSTPVDSENNEELKPEVNLEFNSKVTDSSVITLDIEKTEEEKEAKANIVVSGGEQYNPTLDLSSYQYPTLDLLEKHSDDKREVNPQELEDNKNRIINTLGNYNIQIDKIKATIGPTVTLYEIVPAPGVRISKIKNLENDIALSLAALGIRIIAPIPGKGTIGIEVPNSKPEIVSMRSTLDTEKFVQTNMDLPIVLGKTISNEVLIADLAKMPHLLMAGATGQGKSVGLNVILTSLLYKKHPSQLKFVMVDPKMVELTLYKKIERHFLAKLPDEEDAIITETSKVVKTLNSMCIAMENRYELLKAAGVRNIKEYNEKFISRVLNPNEGHGFIPYLVLIIDEFADLIMTAGKEAEMPLTRLAQLSRAVGIHLVIATQRPSVNIITGTIKANFPARIAFKVTSTIDSRTILDQGGAEQLVGRGDMLFSMGSEVKRLQCAFIDTKEVEKINDFIGSQRGYSSAFLLPEYIDDKTGTKEEYATDERDPLFEEAARLIVQHQQGSTSLIQRRMKLGYNRAGRIIDQLEAAGIIGPFEGSKAREVRYSDLYALEQYLNQDKNNKL